jgi:hypothetical protein
MNPLVLTAVLTLTALAFAALGWLARPPVTRWLLVRRAHRDIPGELWLMAHKSLITREAEHE